MSVNNFAQNFRADLHEILREGWQWAIVKIRLNFSGDPDHGSEYVATLVRRALAEVCTVLVFLVIAVAVYYSLCKL